MIIIIKHDYMYYFLFSRMQKMTDYGIAMLLLVALSFVPSR